MAGLSDPYAALVAPGSTRLPAVSIGGSPLGSLPQILDQYGSPFIAPRDPLADVNPDEMARAVLRDIPVTMLESSWTYQQVRDTLDAHALGLFQQSAMLCDAILGDDRVQSALGSRLGGLFGLPVEHTRVDADTSGDCRFAWADCYSTLGGAAATESVLSEIKRWAVGLGFGIAEVLWDTSVTPWRPYLKPWHPQFCFYDWNTRQYVVSTQDGPVAVVPGNGRWFVHAPHGLYRGWMQGAIRALALPWLLRTFAQRDWARYSERHGLPMLKAKVPAMANKDDKAKFISSLSHIGQEAVVSLPQNVDGTGFDLDMLEATDRSWESFKGLIDRCDTAITLVLQWQNLTTEVTEGSFAAARVHAGVKQTALEFDDSTLTHDLYQQVIRPFAKFNFGDAALAPMTSWDVEPVEDTKTAMESLVAFSTAVKTLTEAGVGFDFAKLAEAYHVQIQPGPAPKPQQVQQVKGGANDDQAEQTESP